MEPGGLDRLAEARILNHKYAILITPLVPASPIWSLFLPINHVRIDDGESR